MKRKGRSVRKAVKDDPFVRGFAYAVANLKRMHDLGVELADAILQSGFSYDEMLGIVDEYDMKQIKKLTREEYRLGQWRAKSRRSGGGR